MKLLVVGLCIAALVFETNAGISETTASTAPLETNDVDNLLVNQEDYSKCGCCYPPCCCKCVEKENYLPVCHDYLDICFIVDTSLSMGGADFQKLIDYVKALGRQFDIGLGKTRVGIVDFAPNATLHRDLASTSDIAGFEQDVDSIFQGANADTNTGDAMLLAAQGVFNGPGDRASAQNVAILLTDGRTTGYLRYLIPSGIAALLAATNNHNYVVGITSAVDRGECIAMAGDASRFYNPASFDDLKNHLANVILDMCEAGEGNTGEVLSSINRQCVCCCPSPYGFGEGCGCTEGFDPV